MEETTSFQKLKGKAAAAKRFALQKGLSSHCAFFIDMSLPSGKNRLFVYDFKKDSLLLAGLVAHGSCNTRYLEKPQFDNTPGCGCSSLGRYKIGGAYQGSFGEAFKLFGLDSSNANAYQRNIVLHGYERMPDNEVFPAPVCNSLGCPMVSSRFFEKLAAIIQKERKPILLWMYE